MGSQRISLIAQLVKNLPAVQETWGSIPGSGRSPGEGHGSWLQYSCLENPMDRGAWWAAVHGVTRVGHDWVTFTFTFQASSKSFHDLVLNNTLLSGCITVYLFTYWRTSWLLPSLGSYEKSCYKHLYMGICVDISFQLLWKNTEGGGDCWLVL